MAKKTKKVNTGFSRRNFLYAVGGLALSASIVGTGTVWFFRNQKIKDLLVLDEQGRAMAGQYLIENPQESDPQKLKELILKKRSEVFSLREYLRNQVSEDFKNDQVVLLRNWTVSRTEARLMAYLSLI